MSQYVEPTLTERLTFFVTKHQRRYLEYLVEQAQRKSKQKVTLSTILRKAVNELINPDDKQILCCNDYPNSICDSIEDAIALKGYREDEYSEDVSPCTVRYWHIQECQHIRVVPNRLKVCDHKTDMPKCPDVTLRSSGITSRCIHSLVHLNRFICKNKKHKPNAS